MIILGVALLAICTLLGVYAGDLLGALLGVKANVGGVGIAMILLIAARVWLKSSGRLGKGLTLGVEFWAAMYIPIVVAMAAQQNVVAAVSGGPIVLIAATGSLVLCFASVAGLSRVGRTEQDRTWGAHADSIIEGEADGEEPHRTAAPVTPGPAPARPADASAGR